MEEQLITFETAKLAKEKGFYINPKGTSIFFFNEGGAIWTLNETGTQTKLIIKEKYMEDNGYVLKVTQSLMQRWLRENHMLFVTTGINRDKVTRRYKYYIDSITDNELIEESFKLFDSHEDALEAGLQEALKLICLKEKQ